MPIICPNCGENNDENATQCVKCGYDMVNWPSVTPGEPDERRYQEPIDGISDYLTMSIFVTLCCCLIFGIVGIFYSATARARKEAGDYQGALAASSAAYKWDIWAIVIGVIVIVVKVSTGLSHY